MVDTNHVKLPETDAELREYTRRFYEEYDGLLRQMSASEKPDLGTVPSDLILDLLRDGQADEAWRLIVALVLAAPSDDALSFVGSGVLEDLVREYGDQLADPIVQTARQNERMLDALASVWGWEHVPDPLRAEVHALLDRRSD